MGAQPSHSDTVALANPSEEPSSAIAAYDAYFEVVYRTLRRAGLPESTVEDAVQDVFLVVHRRWQEFRHRSTLRTWVLGIAMRVASEYRRKGIRAQSGDADAVDALLSDLCPEQIAAARQDHALLFHLLDSLSNEHRSILLLVELEELSMADAAAALEIPTSTAYKRLRKATEAFEQAHRRYRATTRRSGPCPR